MAEDREERENGAPLLLIRVYKHSLDEALKGVCSKHDQLLVENYIQFNDRSYVLLQGGSLISFAAVLCTFFHWRAYILMC